jgi:hypothetical protein
MGIEEFIIGPAEGRTRWLLPSYALRATEASSQHGEHGCLQPSALLSANAQMLIVSDSEIPPFQAS